MTPPGTTPSLRSRCWTWLNRYGLDLSLVLLLTLAGAAVRLLTLQMPELGSDAYQKWHFARQWWFDNDFSRVHWNHHHARLGVNIPTFLVQAVFGFKALGYYVPTLTHAIGQIPLVYVIGKRIGGRAVAMLAVAMLLEVGMMTRASSQLLPGVFSGFWILAAVWALLGYMGAKGRKRAIWSVVCALFVFCAYTVKITNLFFCFGIVAVMIWHGRRWQDIALFCGVLLLGFAAESLVFSLVSSSTNRLSIILGSHLAGAGRARTGETFWYLFKRFGGGMSTGGKLLFYSFFVASVAVVSFMRSPRLNAIVVVVIGFLLGATFSIRQLEPLKLLMPFRERYLTCSIPLVVLVLAGFVVGAARAWWANNGSAHSARFMRSAWFEAGAAAVLAVGLAGKAYWQTKDTLSRHPFVEVPRIERLLNDAYQRNLPIVGPKTKSRRKALVLAYAVYLQPEPLTRDGVLPRLGDLSFTRLNAGHVALLRYPKKYRRYAKKALKTKRCSVRMDRSKGLMATVHPGSDKLPDDCVAKAGR